MPFMSTKTYTYETGLSCCFRQWRAQSHCRFLHGYALQVRFTFGCRELDDKGWVVDFGGLKDLKGWLQTYFDHTTLVAESDPHLEFFREAHSLGILDLRVLPVLGCEGFAYAIYQYADQWLIDAGFGPRCWLDSVEVREHGGNSAIYSGAD